MYIMSYHIMLNVCDEKKVSSTKHKRIYGEMIRKKIKSKMEYLNGVTIILCKSHKLMFYLTIYMLMCV